MSHNYEIEIKSLLGEKDKADKLKAQVEERGGKLLSCHKQLNHYFNLEDPEKLEKDFENLIPKDKKESFKKILEDGSDFSVRTREADGKVIFVIKASVDEGTSHNTVSRMEFEAEMDMTLDELDQKLLDAGLTYQAKWSREREEYQLPEDNANICLDRNAGYGYLAEFERVVDSEEYIQEAKESLLKLMEEFSAIELDQDRLERMFEFYNNNWQEYYGTDKVFVIE